MHSETKEPKIYKKKMGFGNDEGIVYHNAHMEGLIIGCITWKLI